MEDKFKHLRGTGDYEVNGVHFNCSINRRIVNSPDIVACHDDDIILASFPRSGATWTTEMISLLLNGGDIEESRTVNQAVRHPLLELCTEDMPWVKCSLMILRFLRPFLPHFISKHIPDQSAEEFQASMNGLKHADTLPRPRFMRTHLPYQFFPSQALEKKCKIIYVARNPKDMLVSFYHLGRMFTFTGTWADMFDMFISKQFWFGGWFDHVLGYWKHKDDNNVLFLKYEDIKKDHRKALRTLAVFLDVALTDDQEDRIIEWCSFKSMKSQPSVNMVKMFAADDGQDENKQFIRKGVIGDWKNYFTVKQNKVFDEIYKERMEGTGLEFEW